MADRTVQPANPQSLEVKLSALGVTGASFAYWDGTAVQSAVSGLRNSVTGDPVTPDTLMHIGSITKLFTVVLLLQLVDEGRVKLEDRVVKHLPDLILCDRQALKRITCAMLLNHTSGIDGDMLPDHGPDRERIEDAIARCAELGQIHAPGEATSYCNLGSVIAGYLTQALRGESWYTLVKKRIFEPLGMSRSLAELTDLPRFRHAVGDITDPSSGKSVQTTRPFLPLSFAPAGTTLMMTPTDLILFVRALLNGGTGPSGRRILSHALSDRMMRPTAELAIPRCQVGFGWMIPSGGVLTHGGSVSGGVARVCAHPATGRVAALLVNCDRKHAVLEFLDPIVHSWCGHGIRGTMEPRSGALRNPTSYEGVYESRIMRAEVRSGENVLTLRMGLKERILDNSPVGPALPRVALEPLGGDTFEAAAPLPGFPNIQVRFVNPAADGRMHFLATDGRLLPRTSEQLL